MRWTLNVQEHYIIEYVNFPLRAESDPPYSVLQKLPQTFNKCFFLTSITLMMHVEAISEALDTARFMLDKTLYARESIGSVTSPLPDKPLSRATPNVDWGMPQVRLVESYGSPRPDGSSC